MHIQQQKWGQNNHKSKWHTPNNNTFCQHCASSCQHCSYKIVLQSNARPSLLHAETCWVCICCILGTHKYANTQIHKCTNTQIQIQLQITSSTSFLCLLHTRNMLTLEIVLIKVFHKSIAHTASSCMNQSDHEFICARCWNTIF